jgi:NAD(P)-dependent dehydrogenase (short-subunit alcohol dehydrogenase family)
MKENGKPKIAIVTGANRGIGLEACRQLAQRDVLVILTARTAVKASKAAENLRAEGLEVDAQVLDVQSLSDATALSNYTKGKYGKLDILVNNAGVILENDCPITELDVQSAMKALHANCFGALTVTQALLPALLASAEARIINVSSGMAAINDMRGDRSAYRLSKLCLNGISIMLAAELREKAIVNSVCPGWVRTDMGGPNAPRSVEQGAATITYLALDAPSGVRGKFWRDGNVIPW